MAKEPNYRPANARKPAPPASPPAKFSTSRTMGDLTPTERAQKLVGVAVRYWEFDDPEFEDNYALDIATEIRAAVQAERNRYEEGLAELYLISSTFDVARVCDQTIDRSGALLGRIREKAAAIRAMPEQDREDSNG